MTKVSKMAPVAEKPFAEKHIKFLKKAHRCGRSNRPHLISSCDQEKVYAFCECVENILRGQIPLTTKQKKRLQKHLRILKNYADPTIDWKKKRKHISQEGSGIVSTILGVAIPALVSYLASK